MLGVIMLNVIMLSVVMLSVVMLSVIILSVMAPSKTTLLSRLFERRYERQVKDVGQVIKLFFRPILKE